MPDDLEILVTLLRAAFFPKLHRWEATRQAFARHNPPQRWMMDGLDEAQYKSGFERY